MSTTVALCMIVRDEEKHLSGCLASVRGLCDEMIVVDTGSRDATVRIAEDAGCRVVRFAWCDDFSAARNAGIREAKSEWILVLDADERLAPGAAAVIESQLAGVKDFDCGMIKLHDAASLDASADEVLSGKERIGDPMYVPRLLRNAHELAFDGIVHESVRAWMVRTGNRAWDVGVDIIHYGAVPTQRTAKDKGSRNTKLLEKRLAEEPEDFTIHGYLAHEYLSRDETERAWTICEQGWQLMKRSSPATLRSVLRLMAARCLMQFQRGDARGVLQTVSDTLAYEGDGPDVRFFAGRAHEMLGQQAASADERDRELEAAAGAYRKCLAWADKIVAQRYVRGASGYAGKARLATVLLLAGDAGGALQWFEASATERPDHVESVLGACEALVELGRPREALDRLAPMLVSHEGADVWLVCAQAADELGDLEQTKKYLARARETSQRGYLAPHRNALHGTLHCQLVAYLGQPQSGKGAMGTATAIMAGAIASGSIARGERRGLATFVRNMILLGQVHHAEKLLTERAEAMLPGICALVKNVVSALGMSVEEK
jgi:glycosyltransferase involved in cell wall biosynthesis